MWIRLFDVVSSSKKSSLKRIGLMSKGRGNAELGGGFKHFVVFEKFLKVNVIRFYWM